MRVSGQVSKGKSMRRMLSQSLGLFLYILTFASAGWPQIAAATPASIAKLAASVSSQSQACIKCHQDQAVPLAVQQWAESKHAISGIGCYECHQAAKDRPDSFEHFGSRISVVVSPKVCGRVMRSRRKNSKKAITHKRAKFSARWITC